MITITCVKKPTEEFTLLTGKTYSVGRKACDMTFANDQSISRNHATILVDHPIANIGNPALPPSTVVTDLGSKFGTFVNDGISKSERVAMREPNTLQHGDKFRFGLQWNEFKISYKPLISTSSGAIKDMPALKTTICELGAHLLPEWREGCGYLITENLTLTVKAVCALLSAKHIVTPKFFFDYLEAVKGKTKLPDASDYLPPLAEKLRQPFSFEPNKARTKLFYKKIFLFSSPKQAKKIGVAVRCAGGVTDLISSVSSALLKSENTIIISSASDVQPFDSGTKKAIGIYQSAKKRIIPESDIGFAAVYASTDFHCNPFVDVSRAMFPNPMSLISQSQHSMASGSGSLNIIPETQSFAETQKSDCLSQSRVVVDETIDSSQAEPGRTTQVPERVISLTQTQSQSMEFAVPTPRIKEEKDKSDQLRPKIVGEPHSTHRIESVADVTSGIKRRHDTVEAKTTSTASTSVTNTSPVSREPIQKRLRSETNSVQGSRYTAESSKTLSSIFNMSDDDDDEVNEEPNSPTQHTGITEIPDQTPVILIAPVATEIAETQTRRKSPVGNETNQAPERAEFERLKRKKFENDSHAEVVAASTKKRRINQFSAEVSKTPDGFIIPPVPTVVIETPAWISEKRVEPIPESDIKPLPFRFVALVKNVPRPAMLTPEKPNSNRSSSAFNFKSFIKVLPLYMSTTIINGRRESNTQARRKVKPPVLKAYDSHGFVDSEPYVAPNPITRARFSGSTKIEISTSRLIDESMDTSVEEILQSSYDTSSSTSRSNRNNRKTVAANLNTDEMPSSSSSTKKRTARSNVKRSDSPPLPTYNEEKNSFDAMEDDEWAFGSV